MTLVLYSQYFNPNISRRLGRRINKTAAVNFTDERLKNILDSMKLQYEVNEGRYPRIPYETTRIYVIDGNIKKTSLIKIIEKRLM
ncbi:signal recognition particle subunit SRP19/SEC65 family protein [Picrophilus oshimae]|uniref:Hypothetical archaeal signal recognition particle n=1 Tax=Picrophilus torridus (strain ATCC 700027 / DSM 9790 / JCM 10055 / NBRC 100828 / KAW 2/3) TaxID=1122961 RepID=Q6L0D4_PICTO|nr:signal recognition particle subunit SRP19/SEC65 family protein [Picrophilus oshimae]AAT43568.1 hypothetical archaeal signal recognition particle [Picrophilus oshimae DSM 9789]SMD31192.1 signal recognition particle, subunit SRP19 (srp19) [Picrophilus oshimae DSM 9789]